MNNFVDLLNGGCINKKVVWIWSSVRLYQIAQKEAFEIEYWLKLLRDSEYLTSARAESQERRGGRRPRKRSLRVAAGCAYVAARGDRGEPRDPVLQDLCEAEGAAPLSRHAGRPVRRRAAALRAGPEVTGLTASLACTGPGLCQRGRDVGAGRCSLHAAFLPQSERREAVILRSSL